MMTRSKAFLGLAGILLAVVVLLPQGWSSAAAWLQDGQLFLSQTSIVSVDDDFTPDTPGWGVDHFATIQEGVDAVDPGGTVNVAEGIYVETVVIDKDLHLHGAEKTSVIKNNGVPEVCVTLPEGDRKPVICIHDDVSVTIDGFTIQLDVDSDSSTDLSGISVSNTGGSEEVTEATTITIFNNVIEVPFKDMQAVSFAYGIDVYTGYDTNNLAVNIHDNEILRFNLGLFFHLCNKAYGEECSTGNYESIDVVSNNLYDNGKVIQFAEGISAGPEIHFNRIFTVERSSPVAMTIPTMAKVNAEYNWWGCNEGPRKTGSFIEGCLPIDSPSDEFFDVDPWLTLNLSLPDQIKTGQEIPISADLRYTSAGEDSSEFGVVPNGIEITFQATLGSLNPEEGATEDGVAAATYTAPEMGGVDDVCVGLDGETALCEQITVYEPLILTDLGLLVSEDKSVWEPVQGSLDEGFKQVLDPSVGYYYLDVGQLATNVDLKANTYNPFIVDTYPAGYFAYWQERGVEEGAEGWQGIMWEIINGNAPIFYLKVSEVDGILTYDLIDGLQYELCQLDEACTDPDQPLRINGSYLPGAYTFSGELTDSRDYKEPLTVAITFNDLPVAEDMDLQTSKNKALTFSLQARDLHHPNGLFWTIGQPDYGTLSNINLADGSLTYTPPPDWTGTASFTYRIFDGEFFSDLALVTIKVNAAPSTEPLEDVSWLARQSYTLTIPPFTDEEGDELTYSAALADGSDLPDWLEFSPATLTFNGAPDNGDVGAYEIAVTASDGFDETTETFTITVLINPYLYYLPLIGR